MIWCDGERRTALVWLSVMSGGGVNANLEPFWIKKVEGFSLRFCIPCTLVSCLYETSIAYSLYVGSKIATSTLTILSTTLSEGWLCIGTRKILVELEEAAQAHRFLQRSVTNIVVSAPTRKKRLLRIYPRNRYFVLSTTCYFVLRTC